MHDYYTDLTMDIATLWQEQWEFAGVGTRWVINKIQGITDMYGANYGYKYG